MTTGPRAARTVPVTPAVLAAVAAGGALGALARVALTTAVPDRAIGFPWTVLAINVVGSLLLALLPALVGGAARRRRWLPPLLGPGVLGGFTTMSTHAEQSRALVAAGRPGVAAAYVVGTLAAALLAVALASRLTRSWDRP